MTAAVLRSPMTRDAAVAVGMFAVGFLLVRVVPEIRVVWRPEAPAGEGVVLAVLALACAGEVFRRTLPLAGLALASAALATGPIALGATDMGTVLAFADLLYCAVVYPSRRVSRGVCLVSAVVVAGLTVSALVDLGGRGALQAFLNLLLLAVPVLWGFEVRRYRELAESERARAEQASRMADMDRAAAVAAERARMARDLHDVVAGQLSAIALQSEAALTGPSRDPELTGRVLRGVRDASVSALAEMRTMIGLLRAEPGAEPRTAPSRLDRLDPLLASARSWGLQVRVRDERPAGDGTTAAGVELAAFRIVQEGLTNVAKHAPGARVTLDLWHDGDRLVVRLENRAAASGPATAEGTSSGTGLEGLRERAGAVGGTLRAGPDGDGWALEASLPRSGAPAPV
ncbi:MAG: histidine kinase [Actinomycetota bacterium]|nr:histidine kinase [Actinomycetota bacterium]